MLLIEDNDVVQALPAEYQYSYKRQNWFEYSAAEHKAVRENVALFDQMSFGKIRLQGKDAESVLNRVCANSVSVESGRIIYTQWLNEKGGIEADLTIIRLEEDDYLIITSGETEIKDFYGLKTHIRISIGLMDENKRFIEALKKIVNK